MRKTDILRSCFILCSQSNPIVGDLEYNSSLIVGAAEVAYKKSAKILLTPELSLTGYPPEDLLLDSSFLQKCDIVLSRLSKELKKFKNLYVLIGHPYYQNGDLQNCVTVLMNGNTITRYAKQILPNYGVFDEIRYFKPGNSHCVFSVENFCIGIIICEDVWHSFPGKQAKQHGAQILLVPNASPFHIGKHAERESIIKKRSLELEIPIIYLNTVGGQDELVFDGSSFAVDGNGNLVDYQNSFITSNYLLCFRNGSLFGNNIVTTSDTMEKEAYSALVLGVKDYIEKNKFPGVIVGLSGGIDSALVSTIAVDALGSDRVMTVMMPSKYTSNISLIDSRDIAKKLGVRHSEISITEIFHSFNSALFSILQSLQSTHSFDTTQENIQTRIRSTLLMALSNKSGYIVLNTSNKSEIATGYCTLYGDMAGGFSVLRDVTKTLVYRLCMYRNSLSSVIPSRTLIRPPSAELCLNQKDEDILPKYSLLDKIIEDYMMHIDIKSDNNLNKDIRKSIESSEYKRRQLSIGTRITPKAFGKDRRYPITNRFKK